MNTSPDQTSPSTDEVELDEILAALANYIVESIHLTPTPVKLRKLNQRQAKAAIQAHQAIANELSKFQEAE